MHFSLDWDVGDAVHDILNDIGVQVLAQDLANSIKVTHVEDARGAASATRPEQMTDGGTLAP